jgi:hypothetical protein
MVFVVCRFRSRMSMVIRTACKTMNMHENRWQRTIRTGGRTLKVYAALIWTIKLRQAAWARHATYGAF